MTRKGILYISYDGILEPLGQSQVLSYLEHLVVGRQIHLISFEKRRDVCNPTLMLAMTRRIAKSGIIWHRLVYHKNPSALATSYDILAGIILGCWLTFRFGLGVVHARSYVAAVMALGIKRLFGVRFIFDMRGLWADERLEGGIWHPNGSLYRTAKYFERKFFLAADHVVSLTHVAVPEICRFSYLERRQPPFSVIPTCTDLNLFKLQNNRAQRSSVDFTLGYVGSAGTWYVFDAVVKCFRHLLAISPNSRLLVVNRGEHALISDALLEAGVPPSSFELIRAEHSEVPLAMARMDAAVFFYRPMFSKIATSPTRLGEFLACGIPCLTNSGVGDMTDILEGPGVGVAISSFDDSVLKTGVERLLALCVEPRIADRCRSVAEAHFSTPKSFSSSLTRRSSD
jgi:hypothetical protein